MKRTYLARRNALLSGPGLSWGAIALIVVLLAVALRLLAPDAFIRAVAPVLRASDTLSARMSSFFAGFTDAAALMRENQRLGSENAALSAQNRALSAKAADLTALFAAAPGPGAGIAAGVLARPPVAAYGTLIVGAGSADGVASGMEAFGPGDVPLGFASSVTAHFTRVTLLSAPGVTTEGWVGAAHLPITLVGEGAGAFSASVPRAASVAAGDAVSVPGPGALPVGVLARVSGAPSDPVLSLSITPALNPFSITWVTLRSAGTPFLGAVSAASTTP